MRLPQIDPKYEIVRKLREGGMGTIFLVRHKLLEELRVLKVLRSHLNDDEDLKERFMREARIAIQLRHPNIAQLYDFSVDDDGNASIVLEFIDGVTLEEYRAQPEARDILRTLTIARQALRAIGYLHRKGFVHRDIAPDNLMLTKDVDGNPLVKLIDMGIVKVKQKEGKGTESQIFLGKPRYSSPEQLVSSKSIDARSDLYSFGVMLYELVTGVYPIAGDDLTSLIAGHLHRPPITFENSDPGGRIPPALRNVILKTLAKTPDERQQSAEELARDLAAVESTLGGRERTAPFAVPAAARGDRRAMIEAMIAAARERLAAQEFDAAEDEARAVLAAEPARADARSLLEEIASARRRLEAEVRRGRALAAARNAIESRLDASDFAGARSALARATGELGSDLLLQELARAIEERQARAAGGAARFETPTEIATSGAISKAAAVELAPTVVSGRPPQPIPSGSDPPAETSRRTLPPAALGAVAIVLAIAVASGGVWLYRLLTTAPPEDPALQDYVAARAAMETKRWDDAARLLRQAITAENGERARVRAGEPRDYLPYLDLGIVYAEQKNCDEAKKALDASEKQGIVQSTPRFPELTAARERCAAPVEDTRFPAALEQAEQAFALVEKDLQALTRERRTSGVGELFRTRPQLRADHQAVENLVREAETLLAEARARHDLDRVFQASDKIADARERLSELLKTVLAATGESLGKSN